VGNESQEMNYSFIKNNPLLDKEDYYYILDLDSVLNQVRYFKSVWSKHFTNIKFAYSFKSNNLTSITKLMLKEGFCAEVVSLHELKLAVEDGFCGRNIFFDGPFKNNDEISFALSNQVTIQCDNIMELERIVELSIRNGLKPHLSLRISADYRGQGLSRFGMNKEEWHEAIDYLKNHEMTISGIHIHAGSNLTSSNGIVGVLKDFESEIISVRDHLCFFDIGGGYPSSTCGSNSNDIIEQYPVAIAEQLAALKINTEKTTIVLEPGRVLTEDYGFLVTNIISAKSRFGTNIITTAVPGTSIRSSQYGSHRKVYIIPERTGNAEYSFADIYGSNCYEGDIIASNVEIPVDLSLNDKVVVSSCGSYDIMNSSDWIRKRPKVFVISKGATTHEFYRFAC
jgi:diaminopimelate decarboxylase